MLQGKRLVGRSGDVQLEESVPQSKYEVIPECLKGCFTEVSGHMTMVPRGRCVTM